MPNKHRSCFLSLSKETIQEVLDAYKTTSKDSICKQFNITIYALNRIVSDAGATRERYGPERNSLVSVGVKAWCDRNPEKIEARSKAHLGSTRSDEAKRKMQRAAWARMLKQKNRYVSKIEQAFGDHLERKLGLKITRQFRVNGKPFDFLVESNLLMEFDGPHHYTPNYFLWSGDVDGYEKQQKRDRQREVIAAQGGYDFMVVRQDQVDSQGRPRGDLMHSLMARMGYDCI